MNISPIACVLLSRSEVLLESENMATPIVMSNASIYFPTVYVVPLRNLPIIMTGIILEDLKTVWTGNATNFNDAYCDQLLKVLLSAQGIKEWTGAVLLAKKRPVSESACDGTD